MVSVVSLHMSLATFSVQLLFCAGHCFIGNKEFLHSDECANKVEELASMGAVEINAVIPAGQTDTIRRMLAVSARHKNVAISNVLTSSTSGTLGFLRNLAMRLANGKEVGYYVGSQIGSRVGQTVGGAAGFVGGAVAGGVAGGVLGLAASTLFGLSPEWAQLVAHMSSNAGASLGAEAGMKYLMKAGEYIGGKLGGSLGSIPGMQLGALFGLLENIVVYLANGDLLMITGSDVRVAIKPKENIMLPRPEL
mmetsp:Transcript_67863/g.191292  ORF Transcript_67863/g.191292 Transcript_67863/m.191292 type:complete len:250 (+) Transcript_67863:51-800(+)|eukprot:CAMPEP_0179220902 /NCGR_PEP_ID=MMETSP0797-20121207/5886_1 /TAXON_ID=47934 /ORGANISM="Dinophysis acuminata, Strain DAEP01" /LENGTH=249 /DNA_ID=CAMNT_0020927611 /DNA_START=47 /DNA_END=796 /DNA_ORIENTATION=+